MGANARATFAQSARTCRARRANLPRGAPNARAVEARCYTRPVGSFNPVQRGQEGSRVKNVCRFDRPATPHNVRTLAS
jgi:hypothetical protein